MRLLVVKLSALGDVIQTLPAVALIREEFPSVEIDWVVEERNGELLRGHPFLKRVYCFQKEYFKNPLKFISFAGKLREREYDGILDFQGLFKSAILARTARGKYRFGFANYREGSVYFYNVLFRPYDPELHAVKRYFLFARKVLLYLRNGREIEPENLPEIPRSVPVREEIPSSFPVKGPFIVCVPSARWLTKVWPEENWRKLIELLRMEGHFFDILFVGGKNDPQRAYFEKMACEFEGVHSFIGRLNLRELVWVMNRAELIVTVDTGPMHLASLLNRPVVALFGPTSPTRTGPWSELNRVLKTDLPCSPCFKRHCKTLTCMKTLNPRKVAEAISELLIERENCQKIDGPCLSPLNK